jgi:putative spermidine/putrescine transport system permease protein
MTQPAGTSATRGVPAAAPGSGPAAGGAGARRPLRISPYVGLIPFFVFVSIFLLLPTLIVAVGAFQTATGELTLANIQVVLEGPAYGEAFLRSIQLSVTTALAGAFLGALLAWAVAGGNPGGWLRQTIIAASGVLAQFGGVMLAFAFLATFGFNGLFTVLLQDVFGVDTGSGTWLYGMLGLSVVYTYFQIPLMLIVFLPAVDGLRQEWWDASASLGGGSWAYLRYIAGPILFPTFLGATLLLFTNAFSAYATAAALVSQGSPLVTLQIRNAMTSEVILGQENVGKALALGMIIIVSAVMLAYTLIQRRTAKWQR